MYQRCKTTKTHSVVEKQNAILVGVIKYAVRRKQRLGLYMGITNRESLNLETNKHKEFQRLHKIVRR